MKRFSLLILLFSYTLIYSNWEIENEWIDKVDGSFILQFEEKVYIGGGIGIEMKETFGLYNLEENIITQLDNLPFGKRAWSFSFVINGKGYVGCGDTFGNFTGAKNDFWEFNPELNSWRQLDDFPGSPRVGAVSFTHLNKGYVCGGFDGNQSLSDVYRYDPNLELWEKLVDYPEQISFGIAEEIDGRVFIGLGGKGFTGENKKLYEYSELIDDTWVKKADFIGQSRQAASSFVYNNRLYFGGGQTGFTQNHSDFFSYDIKNDKWQKESDLMLPSHVTAWSSTFVYGNNAYFALGADISNFNFTNIIYRTVLQNQKKPVLSLESSLLEFNNIVVGENSVKEVIVSNKGDTTLIISEVDFQEKFEIFSLEKNDEFEFPISIETNNSVTLLVKFRPVENVDYSDIMYIHSNAESKINEVQLIGRTTSNEPTLFLTESKYNFDSLYLGESKTKCLEFNNTGQSTLELKNIRIKNMDSRINLDQKFNSTVEIEPNNKISYCITILSDAKGIINNILLLESNDPKNSTIEIPINAKIIDNSTSVNNTTNENYKIFPNPVKQDQVITISYNSIDLIDSNIYLFSLDGVRINNSIRLISSIQNRSILKLTKNVSSGQYFLVVSNSEHNNIIGKIIVMD